MVQMLPGFDRALARFDLAELEAQHGPVYGMDRELRLAYLNPAWFRFAAENGGEPVIGDSWGLGRAVMEAVPEVLRPFYDKLFGEALARARSPLQPQTLEYECSSAETYRRLAMTVYSLPAGSGLLLVNSTVIEQPHAAPEATAAAEADYRDANRLFCQCAHCRRFRNFSVAERWDWVPAWVAHMPDPTSHSLCPPCFNYFYGGDDPY